MSSSQGSSVNSWLDAQPDNPREYSYNTEPLTARAHKRSRAQRDQASKRCKLGEMSHNTGDRRRRLDGAQKLDKELASGNLTSEPSKRRGRGTAPQVPAEPPFTPTAQRYAPLAPLDEDPTPRPKLAGMVPQLSMPQLHPPSPARPASQATSSSRESNSRTTRSRSPTKRLGDFELSDTRVKMIAIGTEGYSIPSDVKALYRDLMSISKGRGVIPMAVKDIALAELEDLVDDSNFRPSNGQDVEQLATRSSLDHYGLWERVHEILHAALECKNKELAEPSWNSEVHSSLLRLALRGWWQSKDIWYCDITTAKIHDVTLLPTVATGAKLQSKMVDYALVLEEPDDLYEGIISTLRAENRPSINHTMMEALRFSPIAVSIETKRGAVDEDTAHVQLGMWVSAHFARLRQLTDGNGFTQLPVLPLVIVQGFEWKLMFAEAKAGTEKKGQQTVIFNYLRLGDTNSILGIYQVVEAIRRLARWVDEDYKPWFKSEVLAMGQ